MIDIPIVYEDDFLLVVNKPPGIVVNRAESVKGETVQDFVENYLSSQPPFTLSLPEGSRDPVNDIEVEFINRSGIVHRIDKETSGCLLIAKNPEVFLALQQQFKERTIKKSYLAVAHGKIVPDEGEIRAPVGRLPWNRERFGIVPGGKEAVTRYKVRNVIPAPVYPESSRREPGSSEQLSFVELFPETGRTHQIRVHLKYINHPIVGDYLYAGRKTARSDREWAPRVMLHAWKISFIHPVNKTTVSNESPMPEDMQRITRGK